MSNKIYSPQAWTETGLLDELERIDGGHHGHKICFILGAGASVSSGIPTGAQLVDEWLHTEHQRQTDGNETFENWVTKWASEGEKPIKDFNPKFPARFYPQIFERIFTGRYAQAYESLDEKMKDSQPGIGYVSLAQILEFTRHKPVITTNFDNLVAEALYFYSATRPLICGHESLAAFASANTIRPLVAKIHRDLFLNPINDAGTAILADNWKKALTEIFHSHTPIVIGYAGNDGSLMGFLNCLEPGTIHNTIYWCHLAGEQLRDEVLEVVSKHHGKLVRIDGFDQFMLKLHARFSKKWEQKEKRKIEKFIRERADFQIGRYKVDLDKFGTKALTSDSLTNSKRNEVRKRTDKQIGRYRIVSDKFKEVTTSNSAADSKINETFDALKKVSLSVGESDSWWTYLMRASKQKNPTKSDRIFRKAIKKFPTNATLLAYYASFLKKTLKDYDRAEKFYEKAIKVNSHDAEILHNYALFLEEIRKDYDRAEKFYAKAVKADPVNASFLGNYALFLEELRKNYDRAEIFYKKAIETDPSSADVLGNYAVFLEQIRKDGNLARNYFEKALKVDPNHLNNICNYTGFLFTVGEDDKAQPLLNKVITALNSTTPLDTAVEAWYYTFLHGPKNGRAKALKKIKELIIINGAHSSWDFSVHNTRAVTGGHSDAEWLSKLTDVIINKANPNILEGWAAWQNA